MRKISALLVVSALAGVASAQKFETKIDKPLRAEIGLHIPTFSDGNPDLGVNVGLGYSFLRYKNFDLAAVVRGSFYSGDVAGIDYDATLLTYGLDVRYQPMGQKWFAGVGLGAGMTNLDVPGGSGDTTKLAYSVEGGYDFTNKLYGFARFQATLDDIKAYRGVVVGVGYRF